MVMHSGKTNTFNPTRSPMFTASKQMDAAKEIIRSNNRNDFITLLEFMDPQEATDFALCIYKCKVHGLKDQEDRFWLIAKARVAVRGQRARLYTQTLTMNQVIESLGGKNGNKGHGAESNA